MIPGDLIVPSDPKRIGARIQIARMWLAKGQPEVAESLGVAPSTYRGYEAGLSLSPNVLESISQVLLVPSEFFVRGPDSVAQASDLTFRKKVRLKSPPATHIRATASLVPALARLMSHVVNLPPVKLPVASKATGLADIEDVVSRMRQSLGLIDAPLQSVLDLVESLGVLVFWVTTDADFDAVSFWHEERPYILINESHRDGHRVRLSVLHELGHLTMHRAARATDTYEEESARYESDANLFAGAWLMPAAPFMSRFSRQWSLLDILDERHYWKASCAAIVRRAKDLRLISDDRYRQLYMGISSNGWRKREPSAPIPEESRVHQFFLDEAWESFSLTPERIAVQIGTPISWVHEAMPQSRAYDVASHSPLFQRF